MASADRIKETTTSTGIGNLTLLGAMTGFKPLSSFFTPAQSGITLLFVNPSNTEWELSKCTYINATEVSRDTVISSSNNDALVNFSAGTKTVLHTLSANDAAKFFTNNSISYTTSIDFTTGGQRFMPQYAITSVQAFSAAAGTKVAGSLVYVRLVANGTHTPTFIGFKEWGGSLGWDNRSGIVNEVQFFYDGYDYWYTISQAIGAAAVDTTPPTAVSAVVANATPTKVSLTMSESIDPAYVATASDFTVSGHVVTGTPVVSGSSVDLTVTAAFTNGEAARTVGYVQPASNGLRDIAGNLLATFSGLAITNNVAAAATTYVISGANTGTVGVASSNITATLSPTGGTTAGNVTITPSDGGGGGTFTPTTITVSTATQSASFTYTAGSAGAKTISFTNNGGLTNPSNLTFTASAGATAPGAPTIGTATAGDTTASVTFTAPGSNGGSVITGYTATSSPGGLTGTLSGATAAPITVTGLTNGVAYTFTVTATNAIGTSSASAASNSVTPAAAGLSLVAMRKMTAASGTFTGTGTGDTITSGLLSGGILNQCFQNGVDGEFIMRVNALTGAGGNELGIFAGVDDFVLNYNSWGWGMLIRTAGYDPRSTSGQTTLNSVAAAVGDYVRIKRVGTTLTLNVSKDSGATYPSNRLIAQWTVPTTQLYIGVRVVNAGSVDTFSSTGLGAPVRTYARANNLTNVTESGSSPYTYTGNGTVTAFAAANGGTITTAATTTKNFSVTAKIIARGTGEALLTTTASSSVVAPASEYIAIATGPSYVSRYQGSGNTALATITPAVGDLIQINRSNSTEERILVSQDGGVNFTVLKEYPTASNSTNNVQINVTGTTALGEIYSTGLA